MGKKHVRSDDPRKPIITAELKKLSGGNKVTLVTEVEPNVFQGHCQKGGRAGYESLGFYQLRISFGVDPNTGTQVYQTMHDHETGGRVDV